MTYTHFGEGPNAPRKIPVTMIDDLMTGPDYRSMDYSYQAPQRQPQPQTIPMINSYALPEDTNAIANELKQIKYIIIGIAVLLFLFIIIALMRK